MVSVWIVYFSSEVTSMLTGMARLLDQESWVAIVSGLEVGPSSRGVRLQLLAEFLSSESGGEDDQKISAAISRLIIAGNTLAQPTETQMSTTTTTNGTMEKKSVGLLYILPLWCKN